MDEGKFFYGYIEPQRGIPNECNQLDEAIVVTECNNYNSSTFLNNFQVIFFSNSRNATKKNSVSTSSHRTFLTRVVFTQKWGLIIEPSEYIFDTIVSKTLLSSALESP